MTPLMVNLMKLRTLLWKLGARLLVIFNTVILLPTVIGKLYYDLAKYLNVSELVAGSSSIILGVALFFIMLIVFGEAISDD